MIEQSTQHASDALEGTTQNLSNAAVTGTQTASDLAIGSTEYVSGKMENMVHDFENETADWMDENVKFAQDTALDMVTTASLFGQLARSASTSQVDEEGQERLNKYGDPSEKIKEETEDEDAYIPRHRRRHNVNNKR